MMDRFAFGGGDMPEIDYFDDCCRYGLFDRSGGMSKGVYASLNIALRVGDDERTVLANRQLVKKKMAISTLLLARQVHGDKVFALNSPLTDDVTVDGYDALITNCKGVGLVIQTADCQAILLYDPKKRVIGAVHSGWRSSVADIVGVTVEAMQKEYGTKPADLRVVVSPSLGPCCAEFVNYRQELPPDFEDFMVAENYFDFWEITRWQLQRCGVVGRNIGIAGICTSCSDKHFSYRRACRNGNGVTGRNCSVIAMS